MKINQRLIFVQFTILFLLFAGCSERQSETDTTNDDLSNTIISETHFLNGFEPVSDDSLVNVVIEIPSGTDGKWEVEKDTGNLSWEYKDGELRVINYLPYPGNYGMVPRTKMGDGDSIDAIVLGEAMERGSVVETRLIGVLDMLDGGETDGKLIVVPTNTHFSRAHNMVDLEEQFPGVASIIEIWFDNYKGPVNNVEIIGISDGDKAWEMLTEAIEQFD